MSSIKLHADPHHISHLIKKNEIVTIGGILTKHAPIFQGTSGPETRIIMQAKTMYTPVEQQRGNRYTGKIEGLIQLTLNGLLPDNLKPGDSFLVKTKLSPVTSFSTPGSFNYKRHLASKAIFVKGWVQSPVDLVKYYPLNSSAIESGIQTLWFLPEKIRHAIATFLDDTLEQPARGLYKAILIGDRTDVSSSILESFTAAGCIHILAISGVHMGLLALVITAALTWLLKRSQWILLSPMPIRKIVAGCALLPLLFYALIAGFNIPVLRAFLMAAILLLAILFDRPGNLPNNILLAAFLIIIWQPSALLTASFQLSFSAVIAISLIYPILYNLLTRKTSVSRNTKSEQSNPSGQIPSSLLISLKTSLLRWPLAGIGITTAATLGTLPLLIFHFNRISLIAPISNLIVEPIICFWSLIIGLFASLCIPIAPALAKIFFALGGVGLIGAGKTCTFFSSLPYASLWLSTPSILEISLFYISLISASIAFYQGKRERVFSIGVAILCLLLLVSLFSVISISKHIYQTPSVSILDVGHGSSMLLQLPSNQKILIDGGGAGNDRFNIGERIIAPFLWKKRIKRLDAVVITHPHSDHYNGLPFILKRFRPKILWINGVQQELDKEYRQLLKLAAQLNIETRIARADDILFQEEDICLKCIAGGFPTLYNGTAAYGKDTIMKFNPNNTSLVLRLDTMDKSFLFPADIDSAMADALVQQGMDVSADVLLAPHHGSRTSMSQKFIERVNPTFIAISSGRNNPFNLPDKSFFALRKEGITILTTGNDGTLTFTVEEREIQVSRYQIN